MATPKQTRSMYAKLVKARRRFSHALYEGAAQGVIQRKEYHSSARYHFDLCIAELEKETEIALAAALREEISGEC